LKEEGAFMETGRWIEKRQVKKRASDLAF